MRLRQLLENDRFDLELGLPTLKHSRTRGSSEGLSAVTFISYAQNFEDVVLRRALKEIEHGFYIDVGAYDPQADSVTKAFYDAGWSGINIEPNPRHIRKFQQARKRDINLEVAAGRANGRDSLTVFENSGLSTLNELVIADHAGAQKVVLRLDVEVTSLSSIWKNHVPPSWPVHFLKIDVEGTERNVIEGNDWRRNRPWIVVVEATRPMTTIDTSQDWESLLFEARYEFAYFDGLNRFYVAHEHRQLIPELAVPPNVFDDFRLSSHQHLLEKSIRLERSLAKARTERDLAVQARRAMEASTSWRITRPLRSLGRRAKGPS